jgi:DNA-binding IclR family transcriptional regulator
MARPALRRPGRPSSAAARAAQPAERDARFNVALARGLAVLRAFRKGETFLGNTELAERTGVPKATLSRLTFTLHHTGYLHYSDTLGKYQLAPGVLSLGYAVLRDIQIQTLARPLMERLAEESGGTVGLGVRDGLQMIYLDYAHGAMGIATTTSVGTSIPVVSTTMGWACLHAMSGEEQTSVLGELQMEHGAEWPKLKARMQRAFAELDTKGYCLGRGEYIREANSVGTAFVHPNGSTVLALSCSGVRSALPPEALESVWGPRLRALGQYLGASTPDPRARP